MPSPYTVPMLETRLATIADAALISSHRRAMFEAMGRGTAETLDAMTRSFEPWVLPRLADGRYTGWIITDAASAIASAGLSSSNGLPIRSIRLETAGPICSTSSSSPPIDAAAWPANWSTSASPKPIAAAFGSPRCMPLTRDVLSTSRSGFTPPTKCSSLTPPWSERCPS